MTQEPGEVYTPPYEDQTWIDGSVVLLRALNPEFIGWKPDHNGDFWAETTPQNFTAMSQREVDRRQLPGRAMSVALAATLVESYPVLEHALDAFLELSDKPYSWGVAALYASDVRAVTPGLGIQHDPTDTQPWHAVVFGIDRAAITGGAQKQLRRASLIMRQPTSS